MKDEIKNLENKCIRYMVERDRARGESKVLQERIDKVIEYIKKHNVIATNKEYMPKEYEYCCSADLLKILKGE